jgi:hypothetical protein
MGVEPTARGYSCKLCIDYKNQNNLGGEVYHLLFFVPVRHESQPTVRCAALCRTKTGEPFLKYIFWTPNDKHSVRIPY